MDRGDYLKFQMILQFLNLNLQFKEERAANNSCSLKTNVVTIPKILMFYKRRRKDGSL